MGRYSTGALTTQCAKKIKVSDLVKKGLIEKGKFSISTMNWTVNGVDAGSIQIFSIYNDSEQYLQFTYTHTNPEGEKTAMNYKIRLLERPSNLGRGHVVFFQCPVSLKACRILYLAYGSTIFKCRDAYQNRIYYPLQISSKLDRANDQYWQLERHIEQLGKGRASYKYAGKYTRRIIRFNRLLEKQEVAEWLRWQPSAFPERLRRLLYALEDED